MYAKSGASGGRYVEPPPRARVELVSEVWNEPDGFPVFPVWRIFHVVPDPVSTVTTPVLVARVAPSLKFWGWEKTMTLLPGLSHEVDEMVPEPVTSGRSEETFGIGLSLLLSAG
jgi:hypothetical protein